MKRQVTQFDTGRTNATAATPSCSSCCCCCCCLTTALTSSIILARRISKEAREKKVKDPVGLTVLAALFIPVIGLITTGLVWTINNAGSCETREIGGGDLTYRVISHGRDLTYRTCSQPGSELAWVLWIVVPVLVLTYLYARVRMPKPVLRAMIVTAIIWAAVATEAAAGAFLILSGVGIPVYLISVPILVGVGQRIYAKHILGTTKVVENTADGWGP